MIHSPKTKELANRIVDGEVKTIHQWAAILFQGKEPEGALRNLRNSISSLRKHGIYLQRQPDNTLLLINHDPEKLSSYIVEQARKARLAVDNVSATSAVFMRNNPEGAKLLTPVLNSVVQHAQGSMDYTLNLTYSPEHKNLLV